MKVEKAVNVLQDYIKEDNTRNRREKSKYNSYMEELRQAIETMLYVVEFAVDVFYTMEGKGGKIWKKEK